MKFYKRQNLSEISTQNNGWAIEADGRIITEGTNSMQVPRGTVIQRPQGPVNGTIRYNTDLGLTAGGELEAYINGKWEIIKTNRQQQITKQIFENGDYADTIFGPLAYNIDVEKPENVFVFVENVWQIPGINFELIYNESENIITVSTELTQTAPQSTTTLYVSSVADFNPGQQLQGTGLFGNTIVDTSSTSKTIIIFPGTSEIVPEGTAISAQFTQEGTYVKFTESSIPVPFKPVIVLQGFDGYTPPFNA